MKIRFYMDENVNRAISEGLRQRGVDVLRAQDDGRSGAPDDEILDRATELDRVLFSQDDDLLAEARRRQSQGVEFGGVIFAHQLKTTIGECVADLDLFAQAAEHEELIGRVFYLPL